MKAHLYLRNLPNSRRVQDRHTCPSRRLTLLMQPWKSKNLRSSRKKLNLRVRLRQSGALALKASNPVEQKVLHSFYARSRKLRCKASSEEDSRRIVILQPTEPKVSISSARGWKRMFARSWTSSKRHKSSWRRSSYIRTTSWSEWWKSKDSTTKRVKTTRIQRCSTSSWRSRTNSSRPSSIKSTKDSPACQLRSEMSRVKYKLWPIIKTD